MVGKLHHGQENHNLGIGLQPPVSRGDGATFAMHEGAPGPVGSGAAHVGISVSLEDIPLVERIAMSCVE
jgi:hypothetical protein